MSPRTHRSLTSRLAIWSDTSLFALDYRLAPEHPFPAALEDATAAFRTLIARGNPPSQIMVAGDSAGGGLALALLIALRDLGEPLPGGAVLFSPWTDLAATGQSVIDNNERDALCYGSWMAGLASHYLGTTPATHPLASPLYADLTGLPPLVVQASATEILLDDSRRVIAHAVQAGVPARLQLWPNTPHGWQVLAPILPEGRSALRDAAAFIRARLA
jgi:acetyl esterase/lipase